MKKLVFTCIVLIAGLLFTNAFAQVQKPKQSVETADSDTTGKQLKQGTVVPANQTYNIYDDNGVLLGTYTSGKTVTVPVSKGKAKKLNCVEVRCPKGFRNGTICWRCR